MGRWSGARVKRAYEAAIARYGTTCHLCGGASADTVDHIVPRSHGGSDSIENLRPAHLSCNSRRGAMTVAEYRSRYGQPPEAPPSRDW